MSRCFPFPPPGYEKKLVTDDPDLLKKEKRKEKKHKKDKKDKEKKDGKEKKEKNRSEGKHKEKKDKHRDKKKDKEKGDTSTPDDKTISSQPKGYNGESLHYNNEHNKEKIKSTDYQKPSIQFPYQNGDLLRNKIKVEDSENYKFVQELDRRIRDEKNGMGSHQFVNVNKVETQRTNGRQVLMDVAGSSGNVAVSNRINGATPTPLDRHVDKWKDEDWDRQKQEKLKEKSEQKKTERDKNRIIMKSDSVVANNSSTHPLDNSFLCVGNEGSVKKRKDMETNGGFRENELRPNKVARPISNISPDNNGRRFEFPQSLGPQNSLKVGSKGGQRVNGMITSQPVSLPAQKLPIPVISSFPSKPSVKSPPVITNHVAAQSPAVFAPHHHLLPPLSSPPPPPPIAKQPPISRPKPPPPLPTPKKKPPHPDTKYLNQILSVPKPDQWCGFDDQEWLFTSKAGPASNKPSTDDLEVQVWSEAKHIKSVDVCALPYVIPY